MTPRFFAAHKNKIMLVSIAFIVICHIAYFIAGHDSVFIKVFMTFMASAVFLGAFFGIKFILNIRNRFAPLGKISGYAFDVLCVLAALFVTAAFLYDFVFSLGGFNLVVFSAALAFLNAAVRSRVNNKNNKKNKKTGG